MNATVQQAASEQISKRLSQRLVALLLLHCLEPQKKFSARENKRKAQASLDSIPIGLSYLIAWMVAQCRLRMWMLLYSNFLLFFLHQTIETCGKTFSSFFTKSKPTAEYTSSGTWAGV